MSASFLQELNLKKESYPFDWNFADEYIVDIIKDDFKLYLDKSRYTDPDEFLPHHWDRCGHMDYRSDFFNHRDARDPEHYKYFCRCVERWRAVMKDASMNKLLLYIHHTNSEFNRLSELSQVLEPYPNCNAFYVRVNWNSKKNTAYKYELIGNNVACLQLDCTSAGQSFEAIDSVRKNEYIEDQGVHHMWVRLPLKEQREMLREMLFLLAPPRTT